MALCCGAAGNANTHNGVVSVQLTDSLRPVLRTWFAAYLLQKELTVYFTLQ
jgi:hypothetical protein